MLLFSIRFLNNIVNTSQRFPISKQLIKQFLSFEEILKHEPELWMRPLSSWKKQANAMHALSLYYGKTIQHASKQKKRRGFREISPA